MLQHLRVHSNKCSANSFVDSTTICISWMTQKRFLSSHLRCCAPNNSGSAAQTMKQFNWMSTSERETKRFFTTFLRCRSYQITASAARKHFITKNSCVIPGQHRPPTKNRAFLWTSSGGAIILAYGNNAINSQTFGPSADRLEVSPTARSQRKQTASWKTN